MARLPSAMAASLFTQTGKYHPEHHVTRRIIGAFLYRFFQNRTSTLKRRTRMLLIIHESVKSALEILFRFVIAANVAGQLF